MDVRPTEEEGQVVINPGVKPEGRACRAAKRLITGLIEGLMAN